MSYAILYNKQFLKTKEGKIVPVILDGSNNCSETLWNGRQRRARSWNVCTMPHWSNYKIDFTEEELLKLNEQFLDREEFFNINGKYINGKQWYNIVKNAIKQAKTIEELQEWERPTAYLSIYKGREHSSTASKRINTSDDLQEFITFHNNRIQNIDNESIYPKIDFPVEKFLHQKADRKSKPKERLTDFYVVVVDKGNAQYYVSSLTARRLKYSNKTDYAKQFKTEKEAQKWITDKAINVRFGINCIVKKAA